MNQRARVLLFVNGALLLLLIGVGVALAVVDRNDTESTSTSSTAPATVAPDETSVTVGIICTTPRDATDTLVGAWIAGARAAAERCAAAGVVDELFRVDGEGALWTFQGCGGPDPGIPQCQYSYEGGAATFTLNGTEAEGWKVTAMELVAD